jgi:catechol 2,3-dioxygenase-like lactoylglutathione lyase family enzyme
MTPSDKGARLTREESGMDIVGVDLITLGVEDMDAGQKFFRDYGLSEVETGAAGSIFHAKDGTGVAVRHVEDKGLPAAVAPGPNFREAIWGVSSTDVLEAIGANLSADRQVTRDAAGVLRTTDDDGYPIGFQVTKRHAFDAQPSLVNVPGLPPMRKANVIADYVEAAAPSVMSHLVLNTPDPERAGRFYSERLGFRVTDRFTGMGVFLRSAGSFDHHNLFLFKNANLGLHHIAFHVRDHLALMLAGRDLMAKGWESAWGPGRHIFGANHFWYFNSPFGGAMEYDADMDVVDDDWVPREIQMGPNTSAVWNLKWLG